MIRLLFMIRESKYWNRLTLATLHAEVDGIRAEWRLCAEKEHNLDPVLEIKSDNVAVPTRVHTLSHMHYFRFRALNYGGLC